MLTSQCQSPSLGLVSMADLSGSTFFRHEWRIVDHASVLGVALDMLLCVPVCFAAFVLIHSLLFSTRPQVATQNNPLSSCFPRLLTLVLRSPLCYPLQQSLNRQYIIHKSTKKQSGKKETKTGREGGVVVVWLCTRSWSREERRGIAWICALWMFAKIEVAGRW
jgi:hypothetical protein